jgi:hypothetical protein
VSQPYDRQAKVCLPNKLDPSLGEFWVENPWDIVRKGHNLSAYERKRVFWNQRGQNFLDISHLTGADNDADGRSVVAGDFRHNGRLDLVVRNAGGGPVILYENQFPQRHYLEVSLRGVKSNKLGVGARLVAEVGGRQIVREQFPQSSFQSHMPNVVHFGLGADAKVDRLRIRWPSGEMQELTGLAADRHILVTEGMSGSAAVETVVPGNLIKP